MNSAMKSAKTYPLIAVLGSNMDFEGFDLHGPLHYLPVASGFSTIVLKEYSASTTIGND